MHLLTVPATKTTAKVGNNGSEYEIAKDYTLQVLYFNIT